MKPSITKTLMSLFALALATTAFAGGGAIGSGSDGLFPDAKAMQEATQLADVVVPVPPELQEPVPPEVPKYGTLVLKGHRGAEQKNFGYYDRCTTNEKGVIKQFGCGQSYKRLDLEEPESVLPGTYRVFYSNSFQFVEVRLQSTTEVELRKIMVPKVTGRYTYKVFYDWTDARMQESYLQNVWTASKNKEAARTACISKKTAARSACKAFQSDDYRGLMNSAVWFYDEAKVGGSYADGTRLTPERSMITDPSDGDFVSVLPGVYGVEFESTDGDIVTQYGIQVD